MKKIVINGFGRIGKLAYRLLSEKDDYHVVAINSHSRCEDIAYMLKYDTIHRTFNKEISVSDGGITVNDKFTRVLQIDDPKEYPWRELDVDLVLDCTGAFTKKEDAL